VVIGVVALLAALLLPVLARTREAARQTRCASNLRQIGMALQSYVDDNDGRYPFGQVEAEARRDDEKDEGMGDWEEAIQPYVKSDALYRCPDDPSPAEFFEKSYALNGSFAVGLTESAVTHPAATILVADRRNTLLNLDRPALFHWWRWQENVWPSRVLPDPTPAAAQELSLERHFGCFNVLFVDGHVRPTRFPETWGAGSANQYWPQRP
jgi:prepilin-type processing-associated H-X9-DG protein